MGKKWKGAGAGLRAGTLPPAPSRDKAASRLRAFGNRRTASADFCPGLALSLLPAAAYEFDNKGEIGFKYTVKYEISGTETEIAWRAGKLSVNGKARKTIGDTSLPDNVLVYYSGHNDTVSGVVQRYEADFSKRIKGAHSNESRRFIGIGVEYKQLLLAVLLAQPAKNRARRLVGGGSRRGSRTPVARRGWRDVSAANPVCAWSERRRALPHGLPQAGFGDEGGRDDAA